MYTFEPTSGSHTLLRAAVSSRPPSEPNNDDSTPPEGLPGRALSPISGFSSDDLDPNLLTEEDLAKLEKYIQRGAVSSDYLSIAPSRTPPLRRLPSSGASRRAERSGCWGLRHSRAPSNTSFTTTNGYRLAQ